MDNTREKLIEIQNLSGLGEKFERQLAIQKQFAEKMKLIELLNDAYFDYRHGKGDSDMLTNFAEHLIANGVTIATDNNVGDKWIPVTERLPESYETVLVSVRSKANGCRFTLTAAHIGQYEATTNDYRWQDCEVDTEYDEVYDCFWIPECWWESNFMEGNENWIIDSDDYDVTHWMPLPEPPKED